jgi:Glycosyltransferase Family 4/Glycosyl transferases group 1
VPCSLLYVSQIAPPSPLVAARRVAGLSKYLSRLGYHVTVLASDLSGEGEIEGARVVRTHDLITSRLNWRRGHFAALSGSSPATYAPPSRLESVVVPDLALGTWVPFAMPRALRLARRGRFDCVLTTSPPHSAHLIGRALRSRGTPWIAELRDGWTFEPHHVAWPTRLQRSLDGGLERRLLGHADGLVAVTAPIAEDLSQRLGREVAVITNGYDPEESASSDGATSRGLDPDRHSVVYTGRISAGRSTPRPLLDGFRELRRTSPELARRLELVFAGPLTAAETELLDAPDLAGSVKVLGALERDAVLALQRHANSLLVITEGSARRSVATGKLFEYLAARRPILVLGEETEAARIVAETGTGIVTSASNPSLIAAALRSLLEQAPDQRPRSIEQYSYASIAERLAEVIDRVNSC